MQYLKFDDLSKNLKKFFELTSLGVGLTDQSFDQALSLILKLNLEELEILTRGDFAEQIKASSENEIFRMSIDERLVEVGLDVSDKEPIFIYEDLKEVELFGEKRKIYTINSDTTIRAREDFSISPFSGIYYKNNEKFYCEVTDVLLTDRVGLPPIISSLKVKYDNMSKIISERSFKAYDDQWEIFFKETNKLMKNLYNIETSCYRENIIDAVNDKNVDIDVEQKQKRKKKGR